MLSPGGGVDTACTACSEVSSHESGSAHVENEPNLDKLNSCSHIDKLELPSSENDQGGGRLLPRLGCCYLRVIVLDPCEPAKSMLNVSP